MKALVIGTEMARVEVGNKKPVAERAHTQTHTDTHTHTETHKDACMPECMDGHDAC